MLSIILAFAHVQKQHVGKEMKGEESLARLARLCNLSLSTHFCVHLDKEILNIGQEGCTKHHY